MSSAPVLFRLSAAALILCATAQADTIYLKTGEKIEGKVLKETATELTVEIKVSASISDEQVIPKANVEKIEKEQPDLIAWQQLKNIKLGKNSLQPAQYEALMRPLQGFVNDFPQSPHAADASALLANLAAEKVRVDAGEVRLGEKWLSAEEVGKERYQIQAQALVDYMRSQRAAGDLVGVLNSFEVLEKQFAGAQMFPDGVEVAREAIGTLRSAIERARQTFQTKKAEFEAGLANATPTQKAELLAARQREMAPGEAAVAAAEKAKAKWPAFFPNSDKNLEAFTRKLPTEIQRLNTLDLTKLRQGAQLAEQGRKEIAEKKAEAVDTLAKAVQVFPKNELARRLQPEAVALKTAATLAAQAEAQAAAAAAKATPEPKPVATPRPRPAGEVMPEAEKEKPFLLTLGGIITIIVALAAGFAGWAAYNKIRHRANDVLE